MKALLLALMLITGVASTSYALDFNQDSTLVEGKKVIHPPIYPGPPPPGHPPGHGPYPPNPPPVYPPVYPPVPNPGLQAEYIMCASANFSYFQCIFNPWGVVNVRLIQVNSPYACHLNQTFGVLPDRVWVSNGCAGTFEILRQVY